LRKLKVPKLLAVMFVYIVFFGILGLAVYFSIPMFISEIQQFSQLFPEYFEKIAPPLKDLGIEAFQSLEDFTVALGSGLEKASSDILSALAIFFGGISSTIFVLSIALFLSLEENSVEKVISLLSPRKYESSILNIWSRSQTKVAGWFGTRILACLFVGLATFIMLHFFFNVKYAFILGLLSGILNFVPILGPVICGALIFLFVSLDSWAKGIFVLVGFVLIQQIEGSILSPVLTRKFVGLPSSLVLLSLAIGGSLLGILGAILAIPLTGILFEFLRDFLKKKKEEGRVLV
jgi:predicted PurR-regulated permease PerM